MRSPDVKHELRREGVRELSVRFWTLNSALKLLSACACVLGLVPARAE